MGNFTVWKYFKVKDANSATCSLCSKILSCKGKSTSGLKRHLKSKHQLPKEAEEIESDGPQNIAIRHRSNIQNIFSCNKIDDIVAKLVAVDGFSIRSVCNSEFIRESFSIRGMSLPKSETTIKTLIFNKFEVIKMEIKKKIHREIKENCRFSVVLDEWTSLRNRRYLNVCLLGTNNLLLNLGMLHMPGKCGAEQIRSALDNKLNDYDVNFQNCIVATITDGPNVMKKFSKESPTEGLFCLSHGIHLAVIDVLYKKGQTEISTLPNYTGPADQVGLQDDSSDEEEDDFNYVGNFNDNNVVQMNVDYEIVLRQTRRIIKLFRKSPTKNNLLQKYVFEEHKKEISLELDVRTRWNSLVSMINKFLKLKNCIQKALIDLEMGDIWFEENIDVLQNIFDVLNPIKIAVEALCRRDINILTADAVLSTLCQKTTTFTNTIGKQINEALQIRINERRDKRLYTLIKYLKNPDIFSSNDHFFPHATKKSTLLYAENLHNRLFRQNNNETDSSDDNINHIEEELVIEQSFEDKLRDAIQHADKVGPIKKDQNFLKKEFNLYEASGKKTENLQNLLNALMTIRPTSVECERVFSATGIFVNKIRNRLSDESINVLSVLKSYYLNKNANY